MKKLIVILVVINYGCKNINECNYEFQPINCSPQETPKFDDKIIPSINDFGDIMLDSCGIEIIDTIIGIEKRRVVFKPCREMIYETEFKSENGELISKGKIKMMAKGKRWQLQPEKQDEIVVQYEFSQKDFGKNKIHQLNKGLLTHEWKGEVSEGVIENVEEIWMHPFRFNQYNFTEVAPFPEIVFPLKIGNSWTAKLRIQGWGDWNNTTVYSQYRVVTKETVNTNNREIENCWKVESKSEFELGESTFDYWFNEELGFVKMSYENYGGQTLQIELITIIEK